MYRRDFIKLIGLASSATALSSCGVKKGTEKLIPYLVPPEEDIIPGTAVYFNTTCTECPANCGVSVKVREGSPVKLEGIVGHPLNDGALCVRGQAALYRLYHPDRVKTPLLKNVDGQFEPVAWDKALATVREQLTAQSSQGLANLYLSGRTSGSLSELIDIFCNKTGVKRLPEFEPFAYATIREANRILFGRPEIPTYRIENADFLLTIGADIIETFVNPVASARQLARAKNNPKFHWLHIEAHASLTGFQAHERLTLKPRTEVLLLAYLAQNLIKKTGRILPPAIQSALPELSVQQVTENSDIPTDRLQKLVEQLANARRPLLIVGGVAVQHASGLEVAVLSGLIQWLLGMTETTVDFARAENYSHVGNLTDIQNIGNGQPDGKFGVIFLSKIDPIAHTPADMNFREKLLRAGFRVGLTDFMNDTMTTCDLVLPLMHPLESWGDAEPRKGLRLLIQPTLLPIFNDRSEGDILLKLMTENPETAPTFQSHLLARWQQNQGNGTIADFLANGFVEMPVSRTPVELDVPAVLDLLQKMPIPPAPTQPVLYIVPSIRSYDGRSRHLPLLQEIPDPISTISYGRWVSVAAKTAGQLGVKDREQIELTSGKWRATLPVKIQPGLPADVYMVQYDHLETLPAGLDRRTGELHGLVVDLVIARTGKMVPIPILSGSPSQHGRGLIPMPVHLDQEYDKKHHHERVSLYPEVLHKEYRWAMVIDLDSCIGCAACVAACYQENNVPVVGQKQHFIGREMSWISLQPYYEDDGTMEILPMLCQHCTYAPCEPVCPVYAAYHNPEGLNAQVYNRCVGTRYCANNCPYKVRRFNWFDHKVKEQPLSRIYNPDISVRGKGLMEKCTFCVQRIRAAHDVARDENRAIHDGEVIPACAQTCPTKAITFGNLLDKNSQVYRLSHSERAYRVLEELGTEPGIYYLKPKAKKI